MVLQVEALNSYISKYSRLPGGWKMKISCLQENLSRGLAVVGRAVANRATLPVTQNVLLSVDQSMLKLSATLSLIHI